MIWLLIILCFVLLLLVWFLISPVVLEVDTRVPYAAFRWLSIGNARIWHEEDEWWLRIQFLFFHKKMRVAAMKGKPRKAKTITDKRRPHKKVSRGRLLAKLLGVIKTCRVTEWRLSIDTGDYVRNAQLYPLNFLPYAFRHLEVNFTDENYLVLKLRSRPWKMMYAYLH